MPKRLNLFRFQNAENHQPSLETAHIWLKLLKVNQSFVVSVQVVVIMGIIHLVSVMVTYPG